MENKEFYKLLKLTQEYLINIINIDFSKITISDIKETEQMLPLQKDEMLNYNYYLLKLGCKIIRVLMER